MTVTQRQTSREFKEKACPKNRGLGRPLQELSKTELVKNDGTKQRKVMRGVCWVPHFERDAAVGQIIEKPVTTAVCGHLRCATRHGMSIKLCLIDIPRLGHQALGLKGSRNPLPQIA